MGQTLPGTRIKMKTKILRQILGAVVWDTAARVASNMLLRVGAPAEQVERIRLDLIASKPKAELFPNIQRRAYLKIKRRARPGARGYLERMVNARWENRTWKRIRRKIVNDRLTERAQVLLANKTAKGFHAGE